MILLIDNYDSFTYNLYQLMGKINFDIKVVRNDSITIQEIEKLNPSHIVVSPGPGHPKDAGNIIEIIKHFSGQIPILGICLGHQAIGEACGAKIIQADKIYHGKSIEVIIEKTSKIFQGLPKKFLAGRYHSLIVTETPQSMLITARDNDGVIMAIEHETYQVYGLQFHPESILTEFGEQIIKNFLEV
jgi:anthranilate synthase/aminodeoxychorismate synthase-like glutamine amidotransferase